MFIATPCHTLRIPLPNPAGCSFYSAPGFQKAAIRADKKQHKPKMPRNPTALGTLPCLSTVDTGNAHRTVTEHMFCMQKVSGSVASNASFLNSK